MSHVYSTAACIGRANDEQVIFLGVPNGSTLFYRWFLVQSRHHRTLERPVRVARRTSATERGLLVFFKTMIGLFEGTYNPEDGYISQKPHDIPNIYKEYAERLGGKCVVHLEKDSVADFVGQAFFPSGDVFDVTVARIDGRWKLIRFNHWNWSRFWADRLDLYDVSDTKERRSGER